MSEIGDVNLCIGLATFRRPGMLANALQSLADMKIPTGANLRLVLCDNDAEGSAREVVDLFQHTFPFPISYFVEPNRGIVFVRNTILEESLNLGATHIAFFDDDETVDTNWIAEHLSCMERNDSDVVVGKVIYKWPEHLDIHPKLKSKLARASFPKTGQEQKGAGTTNVLFKTALVQKINHRFHLEHNLRGGSDQLFFQILYDKGAKIVWCNEALTYEEVPVTRATAEWLYKRRYRYGYNRFYILKNRYSLGYARKETRRFCILEFLKCLLLWPILPFTTKGFKIDWKGDWLFAKGQLHGYQGKDYFEYKTVHGY